MFISRFLQAAVRVLTLGILTGFGNRSPISRFCPPVNNGEIEINHSYTPTNFYISISKKPSKPSQYSVKNSAQNELFPHETLLLEY